MKKNLFMVAAVALMAMVSCNKEYMNNGTDAPKPSYYVEFTAAIDNEEDAPVLQQAAAQTKTSYNSSKKTTCWSTGDEISVNGKKFRVEELINGGLQARFLNVEELGENFGAPYTAIYPYNATAGTAEVPATQTVSNGTFADESVVTVAYAESGNELSFKHVSSVVKFQVSTEGIKELTFSSASNIAGTINVNANKGGEPSFTAKAGKKEITVKPSSGSFKTNETYYVSVLPTSSASKFEIKAEGVTVKSGNVTFKRNKVMDAKAISVKYVHLKPSLIWGMKSPRYAVYYFVSENESEWVNMGDSDNDGVYSAIVPEKYLSAQCILCRMNPGASENKWENKWNQSPDLAVPSTTNNAYIVKPLTWDKGAGTWATLANAKVYKENAIYLKPGNVWNESSPRFAIYLCNGSSEAKWMSMSKFDEYYGVELPTGFDSNKYKNIIFCRMSPSNTTNKWENKWSQTADLATTKMTSEGYYCCKISGDRDNPTVTWSKKLD